MDERLTKLHRLLSLGQERNTIDKIYQAIRGELASYITNAIALKESSLDIPVVELVSKLKTFFAASSTLKTDTELKKASEEVIRSVAIEPDKLLLQNIKPIYRDRWVESDCAELEYLVNSESKAPYKIKFNLYTRSIEDNYEFQPGYIGKLFDDNLINDLSQVLLAGRQVGQSNCDLMPFVISIEDHFGQVFHFDSTDRGTLKLLNSIPDPRGADLLKKFLSDIRTVFEASPRYSNLIPKKSLNE